MHEIAPWRKVPKEIYILLLVAVCIGSQSCRTRREIAEIGMDLCKHLKAVDGIRIESSGNSYLVGRYEICFNLKSVYPSIGGAASVANYLKGKGWREAVDGDPGPERKWIVYESDVAGTYSTIHQLKQVFYSPNRTHSVMCVYRYVSRYLGCRDKPPENANLMAVVVIGSH